MEPELQPHDALIGTILAERYQIVERIGAGAMGAVYKARHVKVGRLFAVKLLHAALLTDKKLAQRFEREAELAGRLRHVNVIGVIDVGEAPDGIRYMVMDFADGEDLADLLVEAPMPAPRIINLVRQMLDGLGHAHEHGLIHRDFKPENVIVERDQNGVEVPRIIDFGIAILHDAGASVDADGRLTTNGLVLGTPHYMAPEQAVSDPLDHRVDLFALGLVVYEMLSGKLPYDGTGAEVARANLMLDPPPIISRVPQLEVDPLLEAFARVLMAKRRDQRPATARAARELLDLIEHDPAAAAVALKLPAFARAPKATAESTPVAAARIAERAIATSVTDPLRPPGRRWLAGLAGGVVAIGIAVALLLTRSSSRPEALAIQMPDPPAAPVATPVEPVATRPVEPVAPRPAGPVVEPVPAAKPAAPSPAAHKPAPPVHKPIGAPTVARPVEPPRPVVVASIAKPASTPTVEATALGAQYKAVGAAIKALQDSHQEVGDLWRRYSLIQIMNAMTTPDNRVHASAALAAIQRDISARGPSR